MKLLHLAFAGTEQRGVYRKLAEQAVALRRAGAHVDTVIVADSRVGPPPISPGDVSAPYRFIDIPGGGFDTAGREIAFAEISRIIDATSPDVVYLRYPMYDEVVHRFVRAAPPVVLELQTIFANEVPANLAAREAVWAARVLPDIAGLVAVTGEILSYETARAGWDIPGHVMPNGADPDTIPFTSPALAADQVDLLCVASFHPWHGVDRLIVGMAMESDVTDVHLHLVGDGPTVPGLLSLAQEAGLASRVHAHGVVPVSDLGPWYARAHVAIGSLAPHRVGLKELAALKHREYAFRGIPMVLAGGDADLVRTLPWVRQVSADDSPVSPRVLRALALGWTQVARRQQIRRWAESHLSWTAKMPALLAFLESCRVSRLVARAAHSERFA